MLRVFMFALYMLVFLVMVYIHRYVLISPDMKHHVLTDAASLLDDLNGVEVEQILYFHPTKVSFF